MTVPTPPLFDPCPGAPLAIAFSGGGDSTALLHMLKGRTPVPQVFIVDHGLRKTSKAEAASAKAAANAMGLMADILTWDAPQITGGLQAKARSARYALLGQACRKAGISHLAAGHTQDDQSETLLMRYDRKTGWRGAAGMRSRVYAPLWPELADITLHRPLLGRTRQDLRSYNSRQGLQWIEDPSNENRDFARIRARDLLTRQPHIGQHLRSAAHDLQAGLETERRRLRGIFERRVTVSPNGIIHVDKPVPAALLKLLLRAASGTGGPVAAEKLSAAKQTFFEPGFKGATLAGTQIVPAPSGGIFMGPEPARIRGVPPRSKEPPLNKDHKILWEGRFWITARADNLFVKPLFGYLAKLPSHMIAPAKTVPAAFRGHLPLVIDGDGNIVAAGQSDETGQVLITSAVASRLQGNLS